MNYEDCEARLSKFSCDYRNAAAV